MKKCQFFLFIFFILHDFFYYKFIIYLQRNVGKQDKLKSKQCSIECELVRVVGATFPLCQTTWGSAYTNNAHKNNDNNFGSFMAHIPVLDRSMYFTLK